MNILVANDDGYLSPGIAVLRDAVSDLGSPVIVAPDRNQSATSQSLTLRRPISVHQHSPSVYSVEGTPADCVQIALGGLLDDTMDMVVSGINDGPNMGDDVLYSGTVAAAIEGRHLGKPALAVSMGSFAPKHFATAGEVVAQVLKNLASKPLPAQTILNINVPDVPMSELKGLLATRLGTRNPSENITKDPSPRGESMFWIGPAGEPLDQSPGTDFHAVASGYASITPLHIDMTHLNAMQGLGDWLEHFE